MLTCQGKVVCHRLSANRPAEEIRKELKKYELAFEDLLSKHEEFLMLLEDDEQFEHEEAWMEECQEIYLKLSTDTDTTGLKSKRTQKKHRRKFCHCQRSGRNNGKFCQPR